MGDYIKLTHSDASTSCRGPEHYGAEHQGILIEGAIEPLLDKLCPICGYVKSNCTTCGHLYIRSNYWPHAQCNGCLVIEERKQKAKQPKIIRICTECTREFTTTEKAARVTCSVKCADARKQRYIEKRAQRARRRASLKATKLKECVANHMMLEDTRIIKRKRRTEPAKYSWPTIDKQLGG